MKLANPDWVNTLQWDAGHPASLVLEDPMEYRAVVEDVSAQDAGEAGKIIFSQNGGILSLANNGLLIRDLWSVDINQKKLSTGVQKQLVKIGQEEYYSEIFSINQALNTLFEKLSLDSMLPLQWDEPDNLMPFFKAVSMRLEASDDPFERLVDLVRLSAEFTNTQFVILVGARGFLSQAECFSLCSDLSAAGMPLLFLDSFCRYRLPQEKQLIIDDDHCELLLH